MVVVYYACEDETMRYEGCMYIMGLWDGWDATAVMVSGAEIY